MEIIIVAVRNGKVVQHTLTQTHINLHVNTISIALKWRLSYKDGYFHA